MLTSRPLATTDCKHITSLSIQWVTTITTKNVQIIVLPSHSCGVLHKVYNAKLSYSSTQMLADGLKRQRQVSRMTDKKDDTWSPSEMSQVKSRPESLVADSSTPSLQPPATRKVASQQSGTCTKYYVSRFAMPTDLTCTLP